jgi:hypothetical protein
MPITSDDRDDRALDAFFDAARRTPPAPTDALLTRVMADAASVQAAARRPAPRRRALPRLRDVLGGWPAMAGLATAALAGLWSGTALPSSVTGVDDAAYLVDITPEMAFDLAAGEP